MQLTDLQDGVDVCILAVTDSAIADVAAQLSFRQTVLIHCAGSIDAEVLKAGAQEYGVLWPVFSIRRDAPPAHNGFPCVWEAVGKRAQRIVSTLAESLGTTSFQASSAQRAVLHLSAVMGANFFNHLLAICQQLLRSEGCSLSLLAPILQQTLEAASSAADVRALQTGPALRRDANTLEKHLRMLKGQPAWADVYKAISHSIQQS
jgi:predicted short-subunit dehydrogenase-like oxidoreductase (DUF2520 family)